VYVRRGKDKFPLLKIPGQCPLVHLIGVYVKKNEDEECHLLGCDSVWIL
jgi:hypothetical protein